MGEMADFLLEQWEDDDLYWENLMYEEETDSFYGPGRGRASRPLICKFCGKKDLFWDQITLPDKSRKWVMYEKSTASAFAKPHFCPKHKMPFEVLKYFADKQRHRFDAR